MHNIKLNDNILSAVAEYINAKNEAVKADFPIISIDNIVQPKVRGNDIVTLVNGGIKGHAKHIIPYADLNLRKRQYKKKEKEVEPTEDEKTGE